MALEVDLEGPRAGARPGAASSLVVLLHGYGADGQDLIGLAQPLGAALPGAAFLAPNAPERCAVNPGGRQWFPIPKFDGISERKAERESVAAVAALDRLLNREAGRHGLAPERIALVGFSQGTMMALHVGVRTTGQLAGVVGFSGQLVVPERLQKEIRTRPPVLLVHGDADEVIPAGATLEAASRLSEAGVSVRWHISRNVGHGIAEDGLELAREFLARRLRGG